MDFSQFDSKKCLVVTASRRQARHIRHAYQNYQLEQGHQVWHSINVLPWSAFLNQCWGYLVQQSTQKLPSPLNKEQSKHLWQQIVLGSKYTDELLNSQQVVNASYDAWGVLCQWQVEDFSFNHGDADQEAFAEWYFEYKKQLSSRHWLDAQQMASEVLKQLDSVLPLLPEQIAFYGFQQVNPQQQLIIEQLKQYKKPLELMVKPANGNTTFYAAQKPEHEFIAAIRWAQQRLKENPEQQIAILVPDLEQQRGKIERLVQKELYPKEFLAGQKAFYWHDISVAETLEKLPMVEVILTALKLIDSSVTKAELQALLLSPYLYANQEQYGQACQLELDIRKSNKAFYSLKIIQELTFKRQVTLEWLGELSNAHESKETSSSFVEFIKKVLSVLESLHWNGYLALSSHEFQLQKQLLEVIKSAAKLSKVTAEKLTWSQALKTLQRFIQEQSFHQETPQAPIKIMGMLEALAIEYDAIWLLGATDKILPQKATINPFLSKALQLKHQLPGSSHQREIDYAQVILDSLFAHDELVFSYATHDGEQEQLLSPLLQPLAVQHGILPLELDSELSRWLQDWPLAQVEIYQDEIGLPLEADGYTAGGTGLLKTQAASPFDAYLRYRLGLYPLETDDLGVSFMDRGNIFHKVMQALWQHIQTQKALLEYSQDELLSLVDRTITTILNIESKHLYLLNHAGFFTSEKKRLKHLVLAALEFDKGRVAFEVIATEAKRQIEVGGLRLNITIDRIDKLADGSLLIIDYKTGMPRLIDLFNDPIGEPQLLLYAISEHKEQQPVAGLLFYQAHLKANKYIGFTEESEMIKGVKALKDLVNNPYADDVDSAIEQWRNMLNRIAESFKKGEAHLSDYSGNYADHYPVNRWLERDGEFEESLTQLTEANSNE